MFARFLSAFTNKNQKQPTPHKRGQTMREIPPGFDLSIKRRANSVEQIDQNVGRAFIRPKRHVHEKPRKLFFLDKEPLTKESLLDQAAQLTSSQAFHVANKLNIRPQNVQTLRYFINQISITDESMLERVQKALTDETKQSREISQIISPISTTDYPFFDIRYKPSDKGPIIFSTPIDMGLLPVNIEFEIPLLEPGLRVIMQSFMVGVSPPTPRWDTSLIIRVNGYCLKSYGPYSSPLIDLGMFPPGSVVSLMCQAEGCQYKFVVRVANFISLTTFAKEIRNSPIKPEYFDINEASLFCPLTGEPLREPVKGNRCKHSQAFELKTYLKNGIATGRFFCPVCGMPGPPEALRYSHETERLIFHLRSRTFKSPPVPTEDLITPNLPLNDQILFDVEEDF